VPTVSDADFEAVVEEMRGYIADGDVYQVVPSRGFTIDCPDALAAYHVLRHANPSPYMFYLAAPDFELFGASPESALLYSVRSGRVAIRPIAGTRPRGLHPDGSVDHERDTRLELELRTDAKEVAEHVMLVDLARNDVARARRPGPPRGAGPAGPPRRRRLRPGGPRPGRPRPPRRPRPRAGRPG